MLITDRRTHQLTANMNELHTITMLTSGFLTCRNLQLRFEAQHPVFQYLKQTPLGGSL